MELVDPLTAIAQLLGVKPSVFAAYVPIVMILANFGARRIPNDATGWKGFARDVLAFVGAYTPSRVAKGVTMLDVINKVENKVETVESKGEQLKENVQAMDRTLTQTLRTVEEEAPEFPPQLGKPFGGL